MTDQEINEAVARRLGKGHIRDGWEKVCIIPDYCNSIEAAWTIIESLGIPWTTNLHHSNNKWNCHCFHDEVTRNASDKRFGDAEADTAPRALCLAFLALPEGK